MDEKWNHFGTIHTLIEKLNTTEEKIYLMNYLHVLNWLSYFKELNKVIENIQNRQR